MKNPILQAQDQEAAPAKFDVEKLRRDFPILQQKIAGNPLVYFDNAATSQKPLQVIEAISKYYREDNANIHRGVHALSQRATDMYEGAREKVREFIHAEKSREIIFVRGTTEAINLVAQTYGRKNIGAGDEILISHLEHHSNIVPWQMLCQASGAELKVIPINDKGELILPEFERLLSDKTKLLAITHVSNALGTVNPIRWMIQKAHERGVPVLVDGAQAVPHLRVDVRDLDCDFYAFSGHKMFGPTGIGVLYGKEKLLEAMPPWQGGGDMILQVGFDKTTYNELPYKFEAGTPDIAGVIGLGAAIDYLTRNIDFQAALEHEHELLEYATARLSQIPGLRFIGTAHEKLGVISFELEMVHPHDIGTILDQSGVAIRTGHHCAMPVMKRLNLPATARASFAFYNTKQEVEVLVRALECVKQLFG